jgi:pre-rRNA-processing protein TSR3
MLPTLLAANPVNYAKPHRLSSLEALAGALAVMGFWGSASRLLRLYKWGQTFLTLNSNLLESYLSARTSAGMIGIEADFF